MYVIELPEKGTRIRVTNDSIYRSIDIHCNTVDQMEEFALKIVEKVLKTDDF